jgi:hypothetical protein
MRAVVLACLFAACSTAPKDGSLVCGSDGSCPAGSFCSDNNRCYSQGFSFDIGVPDLFGEDLQKPASCSDAVKNQNESDVDCGGVCAGCALGSACNTSSDCKSDVCASTKVCVASSCDDGLKDGTETDVDCGGNACLACVVGKSCVTGNDCASATCDSTTMRCVSPGCSDHAKDGNETDVDCGGNVCAACALGKACVTGTDCTTAFCNASTHVCVADHCGDGVKDGNETDIDCGGACATKCATGKACEAGADCATTFCNESTKLCVANQCLDGASEPNESDVDCGCTSSCPRCPAQDRCTANSDCASQLCCLSTKCEGTQIDTCAFNHCHDGRKDGPETGVDCGGSCTAKCPSGTGCIVAGDCTSGVCHRGICE